jgi:mannosyltransferase
LGTIGLMRRPARRIVSSGQLRLAILIGVILVAITLRLARIDRQPLWLDEHFSLWFARQSIEYLWTVLPTYEVHPPLYHIVLHGWIDLFGTSAVALRSLSLLGALATAPLILLVARKATDTLDRRC